MTSLTLTKATNHYHSERFNHAADLFTVAMEEIEGQSGHDDIFTALPRMALNADASLCRFRSSLGSSAADNGISQDLLLRARADNQLYICALEGVLCSLYLKSPRQEQSSKENEIRNCHLVDKDRLQTSMAILMAAVSGSWLYLHLNGSEEHGKETKSIGLLQRGMALAACSFVAQNPKVFRPTWKEGMGIINTAMSKAKSSPLYSKEVERMYDVLRTVNHAVRLVGLQLRQNSCVNEDQHEERQSVRTKKRERDSNVMASVKRPKLVTNDTNEESDHSTSSEEKEGVDITTCSIEDKSKLALQEHLTGAIYHHRRSRTDTDPSSCDASRKVRDECMRKALELQTLTGGLTGKMKAFLYGTDLLLHRLADNTDDSYNTEQATCNASLTALSSTSRAAASLLGCIYAKNKDYKKALCSFEAALRIHERDEKKDLPEYKNTISNIAQCFGMLGEPESLLEILLHWTTLRNRNTSNTDMVHSVHLDLCQETEALGSKDISVLYRLYFAATLTGDWETCRNAMGQIKLLSKDAIIPIAEAFVALERGHPPDNILDAQVDQSLSDNSIITMASSMYAAEALAAQAITTANNSILDVILVKEKTAETLLLWTKLKSCILTKPGDAIESCIWNNYGIALAVSGRPTEGMSYFLKASKASHDSGESLVCSLPIFNLSLILWREGSKLEACKLYLQNRGYKSNLVAALQGNAACLTSDLDQALIDYNGSTKDVDIRNDISKKYEVECKALDISMLQYVLKEREFG